MRRIGVLAGVLPLLLAAAAPARADLRGTFRLTGGLVVSWQGAPGRCEAAGVCDVHGSLVVAPRDRGTFELSRDGSSFGIGGGGEAAVVRVSRGDATCVDSVGGDVGLLGFDPGVSPDRGLVLTVGRGFDAPALSAGRCAGPTRADLASALPRRAVAAATAVRARLLSLAGRTPFTAGPFAGEVDSTLRLALHARRTVARPRRAVLRARARARALPPGLVRRRVGFAQLSYRISAVRSDLSVGFAAEGAGCDVLDACGMTGTVRQLLPDRGSLDVIATAPMRRGRPRTLGAVLRRPRVRIDAFGAFGGSGTPLSADVARPDGSACHDTVTAEAPRIDAVRAAGGLRLTLARSQPIGGPASRTRCPGPAVSPLEATGLLPLTGARTLQVTLRPSGAAGDGLFALQRSGSVTLTLTRRALSVGADRTVLPS